MGNQFDKIRSYFMKAIEIEDQEKRSRFVEECCRDTPDICDRLQAMILAHHLNDQETPPRETDPVKDPEVFGHHFHVKKLLGEGGFGSVYLAEQEKPLRRKVALKVIKAGKDSEEVIGRFKMEQSALAIMNHPGISKVLETGSTNDGRPFFVMEYVEGMPITEYCDKHQLSIPERLALFSKTCHAITHAHQKGVIHRDLKPTNIMVSEIDGKALSKVIDFGIAKALSNELKEDSFQTQQFHLIGSPLYMSPEQAGRREFPIDTRTDIYSMGALLFQLVTGVPTYDPDRLLKQDLISTLEVIKNEDVPTISNRFANLAPDKQRETAKKRQSTLLEQIRAMEGEISWIVSKATQKDPNERYQSIAEFDQDIHNYLNNRPLTARPPKKLYLLSKFVNRNRVGVSVALAVIFTIVGSLIFSLWQLDRALDAEELAQQRLELAKKAQDETTRQLRAQWGMTYVGNMGVAAAEEAAGDISSAMSMLNLHLKENIKDNSVTEDLRGLEWYFLHHLMNRDHLEIQAVNASYSFVRFLPGTELIATGAYSGLITLLDSKTNELVRVLAAHQGKMINFIDVSPDGKWLASAGDDGCVCVWNLESLELEQSLLVSDEGIHRVFFLADSQRVITSAREPHVRIWNWRDGKQVGELPKIDTDVKSRLAISPDRSMVVTTKRTHSIDLYSLEDGFEHIRRLKHNAGSDPKCFAFSNDGQLVAAGRDEFFVTVWDTQSGELVGENLEGHRDDIQCLTFHPDGDLLASSDRSGVIRFWNLNRQTRDASESSIWPQALWAHEQRVWSIDFSPDGESLVSASKDGKIKRWTGRKQTMLTISKKSHVPKAEWKNGKEILYAEKGQLFRWDVESGQKELVKNFECRVLCITKDPKNDHYAVGTVDGQIYLFNSNDDQLFANWSAHSPNSVNDVEFIPGDSVKLITSGDDDRVACWAWNDGNYDLLMEKKADRSFDDIAVSSSGTYAYINFEDSVLRWDLNADELKPFLVGHENTAECLGLGPFNSLIVTGSDDRTIKVWQASDGQLLHDIAGHDYKIYSIKYSPDRKTIMAGDDYGFLSFSRLDNGRFIMQYDMKRFWPQASQKEFTAIQDICISPDHKKLAVVVARRGILIFDLPNEVAHADQALLDANQPEDLDILDSSDRSRP